MNDNKIIEEHDCIEIECVMKDSQEENGAAPDSALNVEYDMPGADIAVEVHEPSKKRSWFKLKAAVAVACCMLMMFGSGLAGARITERRFSALLDDTKIELQSQNPVTDVFSSDSRVISPVGNVNPSGETLSLTQLFAGANPAVVAISTETTGRNAFGRIVTLPAAGSGFIVSEDGYIVTNNHVIERADNISALLHDGTEYPAVLVGRDPVSDLAVLKIDAKDLSYLTWGDSDSLQVGEQVAVIGNPLGEFANSMTVGYISALDRELNIDGTPRHMLQTDAAVNSGNSGGPIINMKGQVIGVVTAKSSGMNVEGLGFAIPSSRVKDLINQLISDGYVKRPVMGVQIGIQESGGQPSVYIESVNNGSAAEKAGVMAGDIVLSANGSKVSIFEDLKGIINALSPGDLLVLEVRRGSEVITLNVILDEYMPE